MTHSLLGFGCIVDRHARVRAFACAHFESASTAGNVPSAIVFPAHWRRREEELGNEEILCDNVFKMT